MPARQQRAPFNRRPWRAPTPPRISLLAAEISGFTATDVQLFFYNVPYPPDGGQQPALLVVSQMPQILRQRTGEMPTSYTYFPSNGQVIVTYAAPTLEGGEAFWIGPYDPALRTDTGGFCAPARFLLSQPNTSLSPWAAVVTSPTNVHINIPLGATNIDFNPTRWRDNTLAQDCLSALVVPAGGTDLTFTGPCAPGDLIEYYGSIFIPTDAGDQGVLPQVVTST